MAPRDPSSIQRAQGGKFANTAGQQAPKAQTPGQALAIGLAAEHGKRKKKAEGLPALHKKVIKSLLTGQNSVGDAEPEAVAKALTDLVHDGLILSTPQGYKVTSAGSAAAKDPKKPKKRSQ